MLHILNRQNTKSPLRKQDVRPYWFSYNACYKSLWQGLRDKERVTMNVFLDGGDVIDHHIDLQQPSFDVNIHEIDAGSDGASQMALINFILEQTNWSDSDIVYLVEDDYLHRPLWDLILRD